MLLLLLLLLPAPLSRLSGPQSLSAQAEATWSQRDRRQKRLAAWAYGTYYPLTATADAQPSRAPSPLVRETQSCRLRAVSVKVSAA